MMSRTGKKRGSWIGDRGSGIGDREFDSRITIHERRSPPRGFTLIELFLSLAIIGGSLVFIVGGLAGLSRHLSRAESQIQAFSLASEKILEWMEWLGHGGRPEDWASSGKFEENPAFSWQAEVSPTSLDDSLYEMNIKVFGKNRSAPTSFVVNGWREDEKETVG